MPLPNAKPRRYALFDAYGFEVSYSIVAKDTQDPAPIAAELMGGIELDGTKRDLDVRRAFGDSAIAIGNSKVMRKPQKWARKLNGRTAQWDATLAARNSMLLSGGAQPFNVKSKDAQGEGNLPKEVGHLFDLQHNGWWNDRALRLDFRFNRADEFAKLHAAVRVLLPILPGLTAASPVLNGRVTGQQSSRIQSRTAARAHIPELCGPLIPEPVFDQDDHDRTITVPIAQAISTLAPRSSFDPVELNARMATTHFDQGRLSIHAIDAQESSTANMAVAEFIIAVIKAMVSGRWVSSYLQRAWGSDDLRAILLLNAEQGGDAVIEHSDYLLMFGLLKQGDMPVLKLWQHLFVNLYDELSDPAREHISHLLEHGTLASRLLATLGTNPNTAAIRSTYSTLAQCHASDTAFMGHRR
ncbi:MAG TPA: glutamate-cysteine ligase family protein [Flavobacteriales bacterium]|nr:glutamate-cysteine ligase family protein [Flavobacteriales bacterium]